MNLTEEQLNEVETLAGLFFKPEDIMILLGIPVHKLDEFTNILIYGTSQPLSIAFHRGRLKAFVELRQAIKLAALNGSNPAQSAMVEFYKESIL